MPASATRPRVPYATPGDALTFKFNRNRQPEVIAARLDTEIGCDCEPYRDILTAGRWRALGSAIRKGEHAVAHGGKYKTIPLFCRCQLELSQYDLNCQRIAELEAMLRAMNGYTEDIDAIPF